MSVFNSITIETLGLLALAVIGLVFGIKKILKELHLSETGDNILRLMHEELERMSAQNIVLSTELNKLQKEIITLNKQLRQLCAENEKLQTEVVALNIQLETLARNSAGVNNAAS